MQTFSDVGINIRVGSRGQVKTTCPQCSPSRKKKNYPCLNVNVDDGVWHCWHCGWSGALQKQMKGTRLVAEPKYRKPEVKLNVLNADALAYLEERGIPPEVAARNSNLLYQEVHASA